MTTLTEDTTAELADNNLVAVPKAEWDAMQNRVDRLETEVKVQASNTKGAHSRISKLSERVNDVEAQNQETEVHPDPANPTQEAAEQGSHAGETPLETVVSLPEDVANRELKPTQKRARFVAKDLADYGTKVPAGIRIDSQDMRRVLNAAADDGQTIYRTQVRRVMDLLDDLGREDVEIRKRRRTFVIFSTGLADRLDEQQQDQSRNSVRYADEAVRALQVG